MGFSPNIDYLFMRTQPNGHEAGNGGYGQGDT